MGMGDVAGSVLPKVVMLAPPRNGGTLASRYLAPDVVSRDARADGRRLRARRVQRPRQRRRADRQPRGRSISTAS